MSIIIYKFQTSSTKLHFGGDHSKNLIHLINKALKAVNT